MGVTSIYILDARLQGTKGILPNWSPHSCTIQCDLQLSLILLIPIQSLPLWFQLFCILKSDSILRTNRYNVILGRVSGDQHVVRAFKHKVKKDIRCHTKSFLIFTVYQVQGWWTIIQSPFKSQLVGSNVKLVLLKSTWQTHLRH